MHVRMVRGQAGAALVASDVGDAHGLAVEERDAQESFAAGKAPDLRLRGGRDAGRDELVDLAAVVVQDAERAVAGMDQLAAQVNDFLQYRPQLVLGGEGGRGGVEGLQPLRLLADFGVAAVEGADDPVPEECAAGADECELHEHVGERRGAGRRRICAGGGGPPSRAGRGRCPARQVGGRPCATPRDSSYDCVQLPDHHNYARIIAAQIGIGQRDRAWRAAMENPGRRSGADLADFR